MMVAVICPECKTVVERVKDDKWIRTSRLCDNCKKQRGIDYRNKHRRHIRAKAKEFKKLHPERVKGYYHSIKKKHKERNRHLLSRIIDNPKPYLDSIKVPMKKVVVEDDKLRKSLILPVDAELSKQCGGCGKFVGKTLIIDGRGNKYCNLSCFRRSFRNRK